MGYMFCESGERYATVLYHTHASVYSLSHTPRSPEHHHTTADGALWSEY